MTLLNVKIWRRFKWWNGKEIRAYVVNTDLPQGSKRLEIGRLATTGCMNVKFGKRSHIIQRVIPIPIYHFECDIQTCFLLGTQTEWHNFSRAREVTSICHDARGLRLHLCRRSTHKGKQVDIWWMKWYIRLRVTWCMICTCFYKFFPTACDVTRLYGNLTTFSKFVQGFDLSCVQTRLSQVKLGAGWKTDNLRE